LTLAITPAPLSLGFWRLLNHHWRTNLVTGTDVRHHQARLIAASTISINPIEAKYLYVHDFLLSDNDRIIRRKDVLIAVAVAVVDDRGLSKHLVYMSTTAREATPRA
jgi:hypothetical protein